MTQFNLRSARARAQIDIPGIAYATVRKGLAVGWSRRRGDKLPGTFVCRITMDGRTRVETLGTADDGVRGKSWAEALDEAQARFAASQVPKGEAAAGAGIETLGQALDVWLDGKLAGVRTQTTARNTRSGVAFLKREFGADTPLAAMTRARIV